MAGHSKFKNIQFRKGAQDKKRSKIFSKLSRDITLAAKQGVPDPSANARLRLAITNARAESMPKDNIDRAIKKAMGGETDNYEEIRYEGFGPGGIGMIVEVLTDNRNRTASSVRTAFNKSGGNMGESGSVAFMFADRLGQITYPRQRRLGLTPSWKAGRSRPATAEDVGIRRRRPHHLYRLRRSGRGDRSSGSQLWARRKSTGVIWKAKTPRLVAQTDTAVSVYKLIDVPDDDDDVQNVWTPTSTSPTNRRPRTRGRGFGYFRARQSSRLWPQISTG